MIFTLTVVRYRTIFIPFAFFSMAIFRLPLLFQKKLTFWKLMGCGKNGTFDIVPDLHQWAVAACWEDRAAFDQFYAKSFLKRWWNFFGCTTVTYVCTPTEAHGKWDGKLPFGSPTPTSTQNGKVAVLTRATIRFSKLRQFWQNVPAVAKTMETAKGFHLSVGIGEVPFTKQATFSVWDSLDNVKQFAYRQKEHAEVIKKTRKNDWYSEELFARFVLDEIL